MFNTFTGSFRDESIYNSLTREQQSIYNRVIDYFDHGYKTNPVQLLIHGEGGTAKTYLVNKIMRSIFNKLGRINNLVLLLAFTECTVSLLGYQSQHEHKWKD